MSTWLSRYHALMSANFAGQWKMLQPSAERLDKLKPFFMNDKRISFANYFLLGCFLMPLYAAGDQQSKKYQQIPAILEAVEAFVHKEMQELPGQVIVSPGKVDERITLPYCQKLEVFIPVGARLWGNSSAGVRCNSQTPWTIYVQIDVKVMADVIYVVRPTAPGKPLTIDDLTIKNVNLTQIPEEIYTDISQVVGKIPISTLTVGQPVRQHLLRMPHVIVRGQKVKLHVQGRGFSVSSEGHALSDAAEGQAVQVRNQSGRIISGIALPDAIVNVSP